MIWKLATIRTYCNWNKVNTSLPLTTILLWYMIYEEFIALCLTIVLVLIAYYCNACTVHWMQVHCRGKVPLHNYEAYNQCFLYRQKKKFKISQTVTLLVLENTSINLHTVYLSLFMINHNIMWLDISVHYPHTVTIVQGLKEQETSSTDY